MFHTQSGIFTLLSSTSTSLAVYPIVGDDDRNVIMSKEGFMSTTTTISLRSRKISLGHRTLLTVLIALMKNFMTYNYNAQEKYETVCPGCGYKALNTDAMQAHMREMQNDQIHIIKAFGGSTDIE